MPTLYAYFTQHPNMPFPESNSQTHALHDYISFNNTKLLIKTYTMYLQYTEAFANQTNTYIKHITLKTFNWLPSKCFLKVNACLRIISLLIAFRLQNTKHQIQLQS